MNLPAPSLGLFSVPHDIYISAFHTIQRLPFGISMRTTSWKPHLLAIAVMDFGVLRPREGCLLLM